MSDDPAFDPHETGQPGSPEEVTDGAFNEGELDAMLLEASSLASELAEEARSEPAEKDAEGQSPDLTAESGDAVSQVDAQLEEMEQLLHAASGGVGEQNEEPKPSEEPQAEPEPEAEIPAAETAPVGSGAGTEEQQPDKAGTDAEAPEESPPAPETGIALSEEDLAVVGDAATDSAVPEFGDGSPPEPAPAPTAARVTPAAPTAAEAASDEGQPPAWLRRAGRVLAPLSPVGLRACGLGVKGLETLDGYLQRIPLFVKQVLGYLALATVGMACLVLLISLF